MQLWPRCGSRASVYEITSTTGPVSRDGSLALRCFPWPYKTWGCDSTRKTVCWHLLRELQCGHNCLRLHIESLEMGDGHVNKDAKHSAPLGARGVRFHLHSSLLAGLCYSNTLFLSAIYLWCSTCICYKLKLFWNLQIISEQFKRSTKSSVVMALYQDEFYQLL